MMAALSVRPATDLPVGDSYEADQEQRITISGTPATIGNRAALTTAPEWQPVAWNSDGSGERLRLASAQSSIPSTIPPRPVVSVARRPTQSRIPSAPAVPTTEVTAAPAPSASAPTVRIAVPPTAPVAENTLAPPVDADVQSEPSPAPSAPVVQIAKQPRVTETTSSVDTSPAEEAANESGELTAETDLAGTEAVDVTQSTSAAQLAETSGKTDASGELFSPPPVPRSAAGKIMRFVRKGDASSTVENKPAAEMAAAKPKTGGSLSVTVNAPEAPVEEDVPVYKPDVRLALPNAGSTAALRDPVQRPAVSPVPSAPTVGLAAAPATPEPVVETNVPEPPAESFADRAPDLAEAEPRTDSFTAPRRAADRTPARDLGPGSELIGAAPRDIARDLEETRNRDIALQEPRPATDPSARAPQSAMAKSAPAVGAPVPAARPRTPSMQEGGPLPAVEQARAPQMVARAAPSVPTDMTARDVPPAAGGPIGGVDPGKVAPGFPQNLPLARVAPVRPPYLMVVAERAQQHIDYGFSLAERGATFSAEAEFNEALLLVAQALDAAENTHMHSQAMAAGLRAFREADDFVPRDAIEVNIAKTATSHQTPVLKQAATVNMPLLVAMQEYYSYAQYQLSLAGGHEPTAAAALYGLARLQPVIGGTNDMKKMMCGPKAIALHQAALAIDSTNYSAANELGVLLARYGQWPEAQAAFLHSVCVSSQPESWRNLAMSYETLGDRTAAQNAWGRYETVRQTSGSNVAGGGNKPVVKFVDPATFVRASGGNEMGEPPAAQNAQNSLPERQAAAAGAKAPAPQQAVAPAKNDEYPFYWLKSKVSAAFPSTAQKNAAPNQKR